MAMDAMATLRAAYSILPSPLWGGSRAKRAGWGSLLWREARPATLTPTPNPSPQGGGEHTESVA
jgi:hypothetical protein